MPLTVAPPPRKGEAAQGPLFTGSTWSTATDHAAPEPAGPGTEPAHPKPAAIARTVAAGVYLTALAMAIGACLVLVVMSIRLIGSGLARLDFGGAPAALLAVAFATATIAALVVLTWDSPRPRAGTAALAFVLCAAWPLSGIPLPAALIAMLVVGVALARDRRIAGGRRVGGWAALGGFTAAALVLAIAAAAIAETHPAAPPRALAPTPTLDAEPAPAEPETSEPGAVPTDKAAPTGEDEAAPTEDAPTGEADPSAADDGEAAAGATGAAPAADAQSDTAPATDGESAPGDERAPGGESGAPLPDAEPSPAAEQTPLVDSGTPPALDDKAADAETFVRDYYTALNERRFEDAWKTLSPAVKQRFGGFAHWKAGYAKTLYSKPRNIIVAANGDAVTVTHLLVARDEGCSEARFNVTWTLTRSGERWSVEALTASVDGANIAECR